LSYISFVSVIAEYMRNVTLRITSMLRHFLVTLLSKQAVRNAEMRTGKEERHCSEVKILFLRPFPVRNCHMNMGLFLNGYGYTGF